MTVPSALPAPLPLGYKYGEILPVDFVEPYICLNHLNIYAQQFPYQDPL